jgi:outer membrane protein TolC
VGRALVVLAASARLAESSAAASRARKEWYPDFDLSLSYGVKPSLRVTSMDAAGNLTTERMKMDNMISLEIAAPIPLFSKGNQQAQIAEMTSMESKAKSDLLKVQIDLEMRLRQIHASWKEENDCCAFVRLSLIGQAETLYQASLLDYRSGKVSYMELSQARMAMLMAKMELAESRAMAWGYKAEWEAALGLIGINPEEFNEAR